MNVEIIGGLPLEDGDVPQGHHEEERRSLHDRGLVTRGEMESVLTEKENAFDHYATSKSVSQNMLNMSAIQSLLVILVSVFKNGAAVLNSYQIALVVLITVSLLIQFTVFVLLVILAKTHTQQVGASENCTTTALNSTVTSLSGLLLIVSSAISTVAIAGGSVA